MPSIRITTGDWGKQLGQQSLVRVRAALADALDMDPADQDLVVHSVDDNHWINPDATSRLFTRIEVTMWQGQNLAAKQRLFDAFAGVLEAHHVRPNDIKLIIYEVPPENVGLGRRPGEPVTRSP